MPQLEAMQTPTPLSEARDHTLDLTEATHGSFAKGALFSFELFFLLKVHLGASFQTVPATPPRTLEGPETARAGGQPGAVRPGASAPPPLGVHRPRPPPPTFPIPSSSFCAG